MKVAAVATLFTVMLLPGVALAERPMALVEDVKGNIPGVEVMDYVAKGQTIPLSAGQTLVLSYLTSCVSETISGGTVTVGVRESTVEGGTVKRTTQPCDGGNLLLSAAESGKAGVTVMRDAGIGLPGALPKAQITLFKTRPVIVLPEPGTVTIQRVDKEGTAITVQVPKGKIDLAKGKTRLEKGATYRVTSGARSYLVKVDDQAQDEGGVAMGRLIRF